MCTVLKLWQFALFFRFFFVLLEVWNVVLCNPYNGGPRLNTILAKRVRSVARTELLGDDVDDRRGDCVDWKSTIQVIENEQVFPTTSLVPYFWSFLSFPSFLVSLLPRCAGSLDEGGSWVPWFSSFTLDQRQRVLNAQDITCRMQPAVRYNNLPAKVNHCIVDCCYKYRCYQNRTTK